MWRNNDALRITLIYVAVAAVWIGASDYLVLLFTTDPKAIGQLQLLKGWGFVTITGLLLYHLMRRSINDLRHHAAERAAAEAHLAALLDHLSSGVQEIDAEGIITYVNPAYCRIVGFRAADLVGRPVWEMLADEEEATEMRKYLRHLVATRPEPTPYIGRTRTRDGGTVILKVDWTYKRDLAGKLQGFISVINDVTDQQKADEQIRQLDQFRQNVIDNADVWINVLDAGGLVTLWNRAAERISGYSRDEVVGNPAIWEWLYPEPNYRAHIVEQANAILAGSSVEDFKTTIRSKEGREKVIAWNSHRLQDADGAMIGAIAIGRDVSAQVQAEAALRESERRFRQLFENNKAIELLIDPADGRIIEANAAARRYYGYSAEQFGGLAIHDINTLPREEVAQEMARARAEQRDHFYFRHRLASGEVRDVEVHSGPLEVEGSTILYSIVHDITERRRAEQALVESEQRFRHLYENAPLGYQSLDGSGRIVEVNRAWLEMAGYAREEVIGQPFTRFLAAESALDTPPGNGYADRLDGRRFALQRRQGDPLLVHISARAGGDDGLGSLTHCIFSDVTAQARARQQLERTLRALRTLSQCNETLIHAMAEEELLRRITGLAVDTGGYAVAWVALGDSTELRLTAAAAAQPELMQKLESGHGSCLLDCVQVREVIEHGKAVTARSAKEGDDTQCLCWGDLFDSDTPYAFAMLPLQTTGQSYGLLAVYATEAAAFDDEELHLLQELANDLAFGIGMLRTRAERDQMRGALGKSLLQTVKALALTVEKRDPYTAGHQERVGRLASTIAEEMGMSPERVEGMRLGGIIHDIGKIYIPAEILNRPGKLSDTEFAIIKTHPEVGYEIMRNVEFPWPVAQMILQHHERLDGSGYPRGLQGDDIILEARILAVADVVEAITSHRPYRAALGLSLALGEIERGRGTLYDPEVADVCRRVIEEKHFRWE